MAKPNFCTVINCMDGRTQIPVVNFLKKRFDVEFVDMITEAGPIKYLSDQDNEIIIKAIYERIDISIFKHGSKKIAVAGHHDCARNPVSKFEQILQIKKAIEFLKYRYGDYEIIGLWVNDDWEVEECETCIYESIL